MLLECFAQIPNFKGAFCDPNMLFLRHIVQKLSRQTKLISKYSLHSQDATMLVMIILIY